MFQLHLYLTIFFHRLRSQPSEMSQKIHGQWPLSERCWMQMGFVFVDVFFCLLNVPSFSFKSKNKTKWKQSGSPWELLAACFKKWLVCIFHTYHLQYIYIYMRYDRRDAYVFTCFTCLDFVQIQTLDHLVSSCGAWLSCLTLPEPKYPPIRTMLILKWYNLYTLIEQWK